MAVIGITVELSFDGNYLHNTTQRNTAQHSTLVDIQALESSPDIVHPLKTNLQPVESNGSPRRCQVCVLGLNPYTPAYIFTVLPLQHHQHRSQAASEIQVRATRMGLVCNHTETAISVNSWIPCFSVCKICSADIICGKPMTSGILVYHIMA